MSVASVNEAKEEGLEYHLSLSSLCSPMKRMTGFQELEGLSVGKRPSGRAQFPASQLHVLPISAASMARPWGRVKP
jgi:hypothetical protein